MLLENGLMGFPIVRALEVVMLEAVVVLPPDGPSNGVVLVSQIVARLLIVVGTVKKRLKREVTDEAVNTVPLVVLRTPEVVSRLLRLAFGEEIVRFDVYEVVLHVKRVEMVQSRAMSLTNMVGPIMLNRFITGEITLGDVVFSHGVVGLMELPVTISPRVVDVLCLLVILVMLNLA